MDDKIVQLSVLFIAFYALNDVDVVSAVETFKPMFPPPYGCTLSGSGYYWNCWCLNYRYTVAATIDATRTVTLDTATRDARKKRSDPLNGEDYVNGTMGQFVESLDENCDGYLDVTEWVKKASLSDFIDIVNAGLDTNGDGLLTLDELQVFSFRIYPTEEYMVMPMDMYEEMKTVMDMQNDQEGEEEGEGEGDGKGRKGEA